MNKDVCDGGWKEERGEGNDHLSKEAGKGGMEGRRKREEG